MKLLSSAAIVLVCIFSAASCTSLVRAPKLDKQNVEQVELPETVGETARAHGLGTVAIESVALVTGLPGTGSDPPPSLPRQRLLEDMKKRNVENPNQWLADETTALVLVRALLPPAVRKGDRVDIEVRTPSRSKTTDLEGGWLMETRLREVALLGQEVRSGHVRGLAQGPVLVDSLLQEDGDEVAHTRGTVLGGGIATKDRPLGLMLRSEHHNVSTSRLVGAAINRRFDTYVRGKRQGAATPKTDRFIELTIQPRYHNNLIRYLRVIEQIQLRESPEQRLNRLQTLQGELLIPTVSALTALKLEAIGDEAVATLQKGLESASAEVRFYSAEALAYLDEPSAAKHLSRAAHEPAFRSRALLALGAMSRVEAHDELTSLLHVASAETRYGAFRAIQNMNPRDPQLGQRTLDGDLYFHQVESNGESMVHVSRTRRPEIVVFGADHQLSTPLMAVIGKSLVVKADSGGKIRVTRFAPGAEDVTRTCAPNVSALIEVLVEVGVTYPTIVRVLHETKAQGNLTARLEFDAIPTAGRTFSRKQDVADP